MVAYRPVTLSDTDACVDAVIERVGRKITLGLPLGLGKAMRFANALYERARHDSTLELHILTGLSLQAPAGSSSLEKRFLEPFTERLYGDIPRLSYIDDLNRNRLPDNVKVSEFFFQAGSFTKHTGQQRHYVCTNYTHAVRDLMAGGMNVLGQMVAPAPADGNDGQEGDVSLSCNPDLTLDLIPALRRREQAGSPVALVAEINTELPFLGNHAAVSRDTFDVVLSDPDSDHPLFSAPQTAVSTEDHLIGFLASTLLRDGGTLQVGIGSLGSALIHSTILRHRDNSAWRQLYDQLDVGGRFTVSREYGGTGPFQKGLYGCSEMMIDGFIHLMEAGVLTREVYEDVELQEAINDGASPPEGPDAQGGVVMHGGFYLGPRDFYDRLRELSPAQRQRICMTSVNFINDLYDHRFGVQRLKVAQRAHGRFINSAMMHTLNGAAISDGLEDGRVISGVGGQYNFVAMAHDLPGARSIITLRSTRESGGKTVSNILFNYGHCTIPRHLRDIVITEYGIADLRGQPDEQVYLSLIRIADARFQQDLLEQAQAAGKVDTGFSLPDSWKRNTPDALRNALRQADVKDHFPAFPLGSDFTPEEHSLADALQALKAATATRTGLLRTVLRATMKSRAREDDKPLLARMGLDAPQGFRERMERRLLLHALQDLR